jgi:xanthine/uracil permease
MDLVFSAGLCSLHSAKWQSVERLIHSDGANADVIGMFEGEKTSVFYTGLFIFGGCLFGLFAILWFMFVFDVRNTWRYYTPFVFGFSVFLVIGYLLMRIGVRRQPSAPKGDPATPRQ